MRVRLQPEEESAPVRHEALVEEVAAQTQKTPETLFSSGGIDTLAGILLGAIPLGIGIASQFVHGMRNWTDSVIVLAFMGIAFLFFGPLRSYRRLRRSLAATLSVSLLLAVLGGIASVLAYFAATSSGNVDRTLLTTTLMNAGIGLGAAVLAIILLRTAFGRRWERS